MAKPRTTTAGWFPPAPKTYGYVLGIYLGDGCVSQGPRGGPHISVTLDAAYPAIIAECEQALERLVAGLRVRTWHDPRARRVVVSATYAYWTDVLPQHGPGESTTARSSYGIGSDFCSTVLPSSSCAV